MEIVELSGVTHRGITDAPEMQSRLWEILQCKDANASKHAHLLRTSEARGTAPRTCCGCFDLGICEIIAKIGPRWANQLRKYLAYIVLLMALGSFVATILLWVSALMMRSGETSNGTLAKRLSFFELQLDLNTTYWSEIFQRIARQHIPESQVGNHSNMYFGIYTLYWENSQYNATSAAMETHPCMLHYHDCKSGLFQKDSCLLFDPTVDIRFANASDTKGGRLARMCQQCDLAGGIAMYTTLFSTLTMLPVLYLTYQRTSGP